MGNPESHLQRTVPFSFLEERTFSERPRTAVKGEQVLHGA